VSGKTFQISAGYLLRIVAGYFAALLFACLALNLWTQLATLVFETYYPVENPIEGLPWRIQWFLVSSAIVFLLTIVPSAICVVKSEQSGVASKKQCEIAGLIMGAWPLVFLIFLLPFYLPAPLIGYFAGLIYWQVAGRHAGLWKRPVA
jgi:hypothetical protein